MISLKEFQKLDSERLTGMTSDDIMKACEVFVLKLNAGDVSDPVRYLHDEVIAMVMNRNDANVCTICGGDTNGWFYLCRKCWAELK